MYFWIMLNVVVDCFILRLKYLYSIND